MNGGLAAGPFEPQRGFARQDDDRFVGSGCEASRGKSGRAPRAARADSRK